MSSDYAKMAEEYQREADRQEKEIAKLKRLYGKAPASEINRQIAARYEIMHDNRVTAREMRKRAEREKRN